MSPTLLLADDSVTIQRVVELTFADEEIRVIAVGDGQLAIDRIKADPPDIVLADTGMPERDGYDVATFINEDPALAHIPVVLLTGAFDPVDADRARQVGCDEVLVKPFEPQVVINRVRELLGRRSVPAVPATSSRLDGVPPQGGDEDASTLPAETARRPAHDDPDETIGLAARHANSCDAEPAPRSIAGDRVIAPDDPLGLDLDRIDAAFERLDAGESGASGQGRTAPEEPRPSAQETSVSDADFDSLEGALSVLEGALDKLGDESDGARADDAPSTPAPQEILAPRPAASEPQPPSELVIEPASLTAIPGPSEAQGPPPESVSVPPLPGTVAPAPPPEPVVVSASEPAATLPQRSQEVGGLSDGLASPAPPPPPADTSPSLADAFASLLAAEQGDAERAQTVYPWPRPASMPGVNEELIDQVAERVIARLSGGVTGEVVAQVVARVAEKLVREELDRIKQT